MKSDALYRALIIALTAAIVLMIAVIACMIIFPPQGEKFTEFYVLGPDGKADNYPLKFRIGDARPVIAGIVNHEYRDVSYDLVVRLNDGVNVTRLYEENVNVAAGSVWEKMIELQPDRTGADMKIEFLLYADGNYTGPYRDLRLIVDVLQPLK